MILCGDGEISSAQVPRLLMELRRRAMVCHTTLSVHTRLTDADAEFQAAMQDLPPLFQFDEMSGFPSDDLYFDWFR